MFIVIIYLICLNGDTCIADARLEYSIVQKVPFGFIKYPSNADFDRRH